MHQLWIIESIMGKVIGSKITNEFYFSFHNNLQGCVKRMYFIRLICVMSY